MVRLEGTLDEIAQRRDDTADAIVQVVCHTEDRVPELADRIADLFPDATVYDIGERCAQAEVDVVRDTGTEAEPPIPDLFYEYLAGTGLSGKEVDRAMSVFGPLLTAADSFAQASFDEEALFEPPDGESSGVER